MAERNRTCVSRKWAFFAFSSQGLRLGGFVNFLPRFQANGLDACRMEYSPGDWISRIEAFELDEPGVVLSFTSRLARENGWTHAEAARVVREYRRFLVLAMCAGHPVTPSEAVDQAWHLHLVYTKSYWQRLCRDTLGKELHHEPTQGGAAENGKFTDWYQRTLESYQRIFGESAPRSVWPDSGKRFAGAGSWRWIRTPDFWLIRKPRWWPRRMTNRPS